VHLQASSSTSSSHQVTDAVLHHLLPISRKKSCNVRAVYAAVAKYTREAPQEVTEAVNWIANLLKMDVAWKHEQKLHVTKEVLIEAEKISALPLISRLPAKMRAVENHLKILAPLHLKYLLHSALSSQEIKQKFVLQVARLRNDGVSAQEDINELKKTIPRTLFEAGRILISNWARINQIVFDESDVRSLQIFSGIASRYFSIPIQTPDIPITLPRLKAIFFEALNCVDMTPPFYDEFRKSREYRAFLIPIGLNGNPCDRGLRLWEDRLVSTSKVVGRLLEEAEVLRLLQLCRAEHLCLTIRTIPQRIIDQALQEPLTALKSKKYTPEQIDYLMQYIKAGGSCMAPV